MAQGLGPGEDGDVEVALVQTGEVAVVQTRFDRLALDMSEC